MRCLRLSPALLLAVLATVSGCSGEADAVLKRGNGGDPATLDPSFAEDVHAFNVLADLYEGLMTTAADGSVMPGAAESYTVSDDGRSYVFTLRADARWSNGDPLTADDFVRRIRHVADPATASPYAFLLESIDNFAAVRQRSEPMSALGVSAPDSRTVKIDVANPAPQLLSILTMPVAYPMHEDADAVVSNGAYRLAERTSGVIRLTRNERYHDVENVAVRDVEYYPIVDPAAELNMFRAGQLDLTHTIPPGSVDQLQDIVGDSLRVAPKLGLYYIAFDLSERPFNRPALREALSLAVDREVLVRLLGRGEQPAYGLVPPGVQGYTAVQYGWAGLSPEDRHRLAVERLEMAGYTSDDRLAIRLTYDAGDVHERVALAVAAMWEEVLGIEVELTRLEWKLFLDTRERREEWDTMRFAWIGDYDDPTTFTDIFRADSSQNLPGYINPGYDAALDDAAAMPDLDERARRIAAAENILLGDYPFIPLYFYVSKHLVGSRVRGFEDNPLDRHPSRHLALVEGDDD